MKLWCWIVENFPLQRDGNLTEEIVPPEHIRMPDGQPQRSRFQATQWHMEFERFVKDWIERMLFDFSFSFATFRLVG